MPHGVPCGFMIGEAVVWTYTLQGGYGYTQKVDGIVEAITPKRVRIRVKKQTGDYASVSVKPEHLKSKLN